jgi:serine/threonine-protein kinase
MDAMGSRTRVSNEDVDTAGTAKTEVAPITGPGTLPGGPVSTAESAPPLVGNRYEILGLLGSGGMGTVYRARDRELDEIVALKVLKKELAAATGMLERFRREVKLARRVTHKNVARTFDIGEHEGDRFLTMELVSGEMLGALLARRGRVPARDVVAIGRDVCAGLAAAHAADVLHRDLKPENVILAEDGRAVITDFGIARALAHVEMARTAAGLVGTPAYMAPEQVEGAADLDGRADLYALGAMLFELLAGKPAWSGDSVIAIAAARILRPPPDVRTVNPDVPANVAELVLKLMARQKGDRFASADEAGAALAAIATAELPSGRSLPPSDSPARPRVHRKTVAVLPLLNHGDAEDDYLAQTVTEDLVDLLSVVPELRVRPRGETARVDARARGEDPRDVGRALGVDVVVDGSMRRVGDRVRLSLRVITVEEGFQLWARRFDRAPGEVVSIADEAASAISLALAAERTAGPAQPTGDPVAQELYLRGRYLLQRGWLAVSQEGTELIRQAHERAPDDTRIAGTYALATSRVLTSGEMGQGAGAAARALAERTLERNPSQHEARVALAFIHLSESEFAAASVQLMRALALAPNSVEALDAAGRLLAEVGPPEMAIEMLRKAIAIDPGINQARHALGRLHALFGDLDIARDVFGPVPTQSHDFAPYVLLNARFALWRDDPAAARGLVRLITESKVATLPLLREAVLGFAEITINRELAAGISDKLDLVLPFDNRYPPRRLAFHAQLRVEAKLGMRDLDGALHDLRVADTNGLLDLMWLDHCLIFDAVRGSQEFATIRENTALRAERVRRILAP